MIGSKKYLLTIFLILISISSYGNPTNTKNILILNSYHKGYKWSDDIIQGIEASLNESNFTCNISIEYMGTKHLSDEVYYKQLYEIYKRKYLKNRIDIIVTTDDNAFNFIKKFREDLFPNIPVVFCGVNNFNKNRIDNFNNYTGVNEATDITSTVELVLKIHPETNALVFINDATTTGLKLNKQIEQLRANIPASVSVEIWTDYSMKEIQKKTSNLKRGTVVIYTLFFRDKNNQFFEYDKSIINIQRFSKVPIYGTWDFSLGFGIVGGKLTSGYFQGLTAGGLVEDVFEGINISEIPVKYESPNQYMFDFKVLEKHKIEKSQLPPNSLIINEPNTFYNENPQIVWTVGLIIIFLVVVLILVSIDSSKRKKLADALNKANLLLEEKVAERTKELLSTNSQLKYEVIEKENSKNELIQLHNQNKSLIESLSSILIAIDHEENIVIWNRVAEATFRINSFDVVGKKIEDCFVQWNVNDIKAKVKEALIKNITTSLREVKFVKINGKHGFLYMKFNPYQVSNSEKKGVLIVCEDITEIKVLESQLVQSQKLESIGQLAAGIAHEINTPAQYVNDNTTFIKESLENIFSLINELNKFRIAQNGNTALNQLNTDIEKLIEEIDYEFLSKEIPVALDQSLDGLKSIASIVKAMKSFSHPGEDNKNSADINKLINNTIMVSKNEWKYVANISTELDESIDKIICYPGLLNQVFVNLIINSSHAIEEKNKNTNSGVGEIIIRTKQLKGNIKIEIEDTGGGIPNEILNRIFDPFFTTKEVGKGTGQGLAIAHDIITNKHKGHINVYSEEGKGSKFTILLPIQN